MIDARTKNPPANRRVSVLGPLRAWLPEFIDQSMKKLKPAVTVWSVRWMVGSVPPPLHS